MKYKTTPWQHQRKDVDRIDEEHINHYALFYDMGAGKTKTAVDILRSIYMRNGRLLKTLIICPIVVLENWKRELLTHSHLDGRAIQVVDGCTNERGKKLKTATLKRKVAQLDNPHAGIFIINTETAANKNLWPTILEMGFRALVVDESHRFKSFNSNRTKALHTLTLQPQMEYRYILTGSPVLQDAQDLWSQFFILDPDILGRNFYSFRATYFYDANAGMPSNVHFPNWKPKGYMYYKKLGLPYEDDTAKLNSIIYKHASRVMKDDVLDLPDFITQRVPVPFTKEQSRIYEEMKEDLVATLEESDVKEDFDLMSLEDLDEANVMSADLAIVKTLRLMQLIAGVFTAEDGTITVLETNREKVLKELLSELTSNKENKIIIWTVLTPTYTVIAEICKVLGIRCTFLTGQQSKDEKQKNVDDFNNDKTIQVMIANQGAGGTGVNLTASNYSIYYTRSFNLEHDIQSEARNYRGGQTRKVTRIDLVTEDTMDDRILEALAAKKEGAEDILAKKEKVTRADILRCV